MTGTTNSEPNPLPAPWADMDAMYVQSDNMAACAIYALNQCANQRAEAICARLDRLIAQAEAREGAGVPPVTHSPELPTTHNT